MIDCRSGVPSRSITENNIRGHALKAGVTNAFDFPGFVPAYIRALLRGAWTVPLGGASGDPADIAATDKPGARHVSRQRLTLPLDPPGAREDPIPGPALPHLLLGYGSVPPSGCA